MVHVSGRRRRESLDEGAAAVAVAASSAQVSIGGACPRARATIFAVCCVRTSGLARMRCTDSPLRTSSRAAASVRARPLAVSSRLKSRVVGSPASAGPCRMMKSRIGQARSRQAEHDAGGDLERSPPRRLLTRRGPVLRYRALRRRSRETRCVGGSASRS